MDLCVGEDDLWVSRRHGELTFSKQRWWLRNTGQQLLRLPRGRLMHAATKAFPLAPGYTPVFVRGSGFREHLVELYVTGHDEERAPRRRAATLPPRRWPLDDDERLLLVVLGQRYLLYEEGPRPSRTGRRPSSSPTCAPAATGGSAGSRTGSRPCAAAWTRADSRTR
ncbi:hypothetical protein ACFQQB_02560 [Nonomuraea rubra]|uniref:hypothetical protein n=1 Tax=Nonomuraea rubra TaxID=46180 RepID=UPI0036148E3E